MKRIRSLWLIALFSVFAGYSLSRAETTLEKIDRSAVLVIGTRTGSPPFAYVNKNNEWVGFSIDLVEKAILPVLNQKLNKQIKLEKKESAPQTRIPLLTSNAVDLIAETMTDTQSRRDQVDFSLTFFATGAQFLVKKGSPIKGLQSIAGKRIAAQQGSTNAKLIRERRFKHWLKDRFKPIPTTAFNWPVCARKRLNPTITPWSASSFPMNRTAWRCARMILTFAKL